MSDKSPTERVREMLDERGIPWVELRDGKTAFESPILGVRVSLTECDSGFLVSAGYKALPPEQAIAATVGDKPKDNPRNYNPDGTPKIPNMHIGADPDWVDWVARLKHEGPLNLKEAVEQLMFEIICFGGDMGPNDCGGEHCPDEGMVYTNDFINGWVNKIAATVGRPKVRKVRGMTYDEHGGEVYYLACSGCGEWIDADLDCITEFDGPNFCHNCGGEFDGPLLCKRCGGLADLEYGDMCAECYEKVESE